MITLKIDNFIIFLGKSVLKYPKYSLCDLFIKSKDFPFVLPGNVGLGWSNYESTLEPLTKDESISANEVIKVIFLINVTVEKNLKTNFLNLDKK